MAINFTNPRARFFDANGNPLSSGEVSFYEAGSTTLKEIYTDFTEATPADNPNTLDTQGFVVPSTGVWLGEGNYKIEVKDSLGATLWTYDNIEGSQALSNALSVSYVETIADLKNLSAGASNFVFVSGYYSSGDGGGRLMRWVSSESASDNLGTIISPIANPALGRWVYVPINGNDSLSSLLFGAFPSNGSIEVSSNFIQLISFASSSNYSEINISKGDYYCNANLDFLGDFVVTMAKGARFRASSGDSTINFNCSKVNVEGVGYICQVGSSPSVNVVFNGDEEVYPEYWGASGDGATDDMGPLTFASNNSNGPIRFQGTYLLSSSGIALIGKTLKFEDGAKLSISGATVLVDKVESESFTPIFTGDLNLLDFTENKAKASWLDIIEGAVFYGSRFSTFANAKADDFTLIFDKKNTCSVDAGFILSNQTFNTVFEVSQNIEVNFACEFGRISAPDFPLFTSSGSGGRVKTISGYSLHWFLKPYVSTTNGSALLFALQSVAYSGGIIDLKGDTFLTSDVIGTVTQSNKITIKNGKMTFVGVPTADILTTTGKLEFNNIEFNNGNTSNNFGLVPASDFKAINCGFFGGSKIIFHDDPSPLSITNSTFEITSGGLEDFYTATNEITLTDNFFSLEGGTVKFRGIDGSISNNVFNAGKVWVLDPTRVKVNNNTFNSSSTKQANLYFHSVVSSFVVKGLVCNGNYQIEASTTDPQRTSKFIAQTGSSTFASTGHECQIINNSSDTIPFSATTIKGKLQASTVAWTLGSNVVSLDFSVVGNEKIIFSKGTLPYNFLNGVRDVSSTSQGYLTLRNTGTLPTVDLNVESTTINATAVQFYFQFDVSNINKENTLLI